MSNEEVSNLLTESLYKKSRTKKCLLYADGDVDFFCHARLRGKIQLIIPQACAFICSMLKKNDQQWNNPLCMCIHKCVCTYIFVSLVDAKSTKNAKFS